MFVAARCCLQILAAPPSGQRDCSWRRVMRVPPRPFYGNSAVIMSEAALCVADHPKEESDGGYGGGNSDGNPIVDDGGGGPVSVLPRPHRAH